jgi:hypothetical protein
MRMESEVTFIDMISLGCLIRGILIPHYSKIGAKRTWTYITMSAGIAY